MDTRTIKRSSLEGAACGLIIAAGLVLACTDSPTSTRAPTTYAVGGMVTGLEGSGLVLRNNGGDDLNVTANGPVVFATPLASGASYSVTVLTQPTSPGQTCIVASGSGTVTDADVATVGIFCAANTYTVGGTVSGLVGTGLVLRNNGGDDLAVSSNGTVTFSTSLSSGAAYGVTVFKQPTSPAQGCEVTGGSGTLATANVTNVTIVCSSSAYTVGGTVSGLVGTGLVLRNNGGDDLSVTANGSFTFTTPLSSGAAYAVTVFTQPASPAQSCAVTNGNGTVAAASITTVAIACTTGTPQLYAVGGTVSGLTGSGLVLRNNGGDDLMVSANGTFSFATPLVSGTAYSVTVFSQPTNPAQTCVVTGGSGTVATVNVTTVAVACVTNAGMGTVRVTTSTAGAVSSNYTVVVDPGSSGSSSFDVPANGPVSFNLAPGVHKVSLTAAPSCTVTSPNPVPVTVISGTTTDIAFSVTCVANGTVQVTVSTTGPNVPASFGVRVTGVFDTYGTYSASIPPHGAVSLAVRPGLYEVRLVVPANCTVASPSILGVSVFLGTTTRVAFRVTCVPAGTLGVTTATTGPNSPATYTVGAYPYWGTNLYSVAIPPNGTVTMILSPGSHTVLLAVPPNCTVDSPNNVSVNVLAGTTSNIAFTVTCQ